MSALALMVPEGCGGTVREGRAPAGGRVKCAAADTVWGAQTLAWATLGCIWLCDPEQDTGPL